ncbi:MAG: serine/threonine protein kinase, partial [Deltaproteobacteria bacterium]|nr:serine/threonine protein kinase [Deltaproteobacteria bacterium]
NQESRDRFEREAHAVAKLRHENILEIFDFSGTKSDESYIVTEFIDGQTLKELVAHYRIRFPEIGAMIVVEVLRALSHAHGAGILHRDIKPENIMVRSDGVVKLTDFGIAQMVDLQRMTLTGQLLGSPAYMSPEHVSGGTLDFRTDVFSVGILLYQLVTGELPFKGKNPHEILKRIAECNYQPPQMMEPLVGERLGGIIQRAMAKDKDDRYPDVTRMLADLDGFLADSGLDGVEDELHRFFASPASYEMALERRLLAAWIGRGKELWAEQRNQAIDYYNRVLVVDPDNREVLEVLDRASRRRRGARLVALFAGVGVIVGAAALAKGMGNDQRSAAKASDGGAIAAAPLDAAPVADSAAISASTDAALVDAAAASPPDAGRIRRVVPPRRRADASVAAGPSRSFELKIFPLGSEVKVAGGTWQKAKGRKLTVAVPAGSVQISVRNDACCQAKSITIGPREAPGARSINLTYLPGMVIPSCSVAGVQVQVDGRTARLDRASPVLLNETLDGSRKVKVDFIRAGGAGLDSQTVLVRYRETKKVKCAF